MFSEGSIRSQTNYDTKKYVEAEVIKALQRKEYTLNTVNSYGENLLHISAANGCLDIIKEILQNQNSCHLINRKNKFGWTPLMLAIRNRDIQMVKYLLDKNANVNESSYLGMSVLGLAAAVSEDIFEIVYKACPSALLHSINDDITPLCIAAMKNDEDLFFKLIELGFDTSKNNEYTNIMIKQSKLPAIKKLAKQYHDIEDYWNNDSDNILVENESNENDHLKLSKLENRNEELCFIERIHNSIQNKYNNRNKNNNVTTLNYPDIPTFVFSTAETNTNDCNNNVKPSNKLLRPCTLNLMVNEVEVAPDSSISPTSCSTLSEILPDSPNIYFIQNEHTDDNNLNITYSIGDKQLIRDKNGLITTYLYNKNDSSKLPLQRLQSIRPPDLNIQSEDLDSTAIGYVPEFSPLRSPNVPPDINDEDVFGEDTPTPPRYKTPPRGMILNSEEAKMFALLKHYGLSHYVPIFLEQEVDIDLFMTLTNQDLIEIGIANETDRKAILNVIMNYKKLMI